MQSTNGSIAGLNDWELMFCWHPTREEFHQWLDSDLREFAKKENRIPKLSTEAWLEKHIASDIHAIFFATYGNELFDWLSKLTDRNTFKKKKKHCLDTGADSDHTEPRQSDYESSGLLAYQCARRLCYRICS